MIAASNALGIVVLIVLVPALVYLHMKREVKRDEKLNRYAGGKFNSPARKLGQKMSRKK